MPKGEEAATTEMFGENTLGIDRGQEEPQRKGGRINGKNKGLINTRVEKRGPGKAGKILTVVSTTVPANVLATVPAKSATRSTQARTIVSPEGGTGKLTLRNVSVTSLELVVWNVFSVP